MTEYSSGNYTRFFGTLLLMHINAFARKTSLELDDMERFATIQSISHHFATCAIAATSCLVLFLTQNPGVSGVVYFVMPLVHGVLASVFITWSQKQFK